MRVRVTYEWGYVQNVSEAPNKKNTSTMSEEEIGRKKNTKSPQSIELHLLVLGYPSGTVAIWPVSGSCLVGWVWVGAVHRARGVRFWVCEDRSDVLFDLSAADDRRQ
jgi:hypothetical protein